MHGFSYLYRNPKMRASWELVVRFTQNLFYFDYIAISGVPYFQGVFLLCSSPVVLNSRSACNQVILFLFLALLKNNLEILPLTGYNSLPQKRMVWTWSRKIRTFVRTLVSGSHKKLLWRDLDARWALLMGWSISSLLCPIGINVDRALNFWCTLSGLHFVSSK